LAPVKIEVRYELLEAGNPAAKALSSGMELSITVPCTVEEQCRLAIQEQEEEEQVIRRPKCKLQKARRYRADGDSYALLRPHWQASGAIVTATLLKCHLARFVHIRGHFLTLKTGVN
jgi:hypothetical protein